MKTTEKQFDAVKLSDKLSKMTKAEIVEYFKKKKLASQINPSA
jgi:hypothetical protein